MFGYMYPSAPSPAKEPIKVGSVWEYSPGSSPGGRFVAKAYNLGTDTWTTQDLDKDHAEHVCTEEVILKWSIMTKIQPDQRWLDQDGRERVIIDPCDQMWIFGHRAWDWNTRRHDRTIQRYSEVSMFKDWTFVDPSAVTPHPQITHAKCPLCATRGFPCFNMFKCENLHCRNYAPTRP